MAKSTPLVVLKSFFGYKENQSLKEFRDEINQLSAEEKRELVDLVAVELGVDVDWSQIVMAKSA